MTGTLQKSRRPHVAIILDGNGRWAKERARPRCAGHRAGARAVRRVVEAAGRQGIPVLTLFAFSADNWQRPSAEVEALMALFERYLTTEASHCLENGVCLNVIGRRDRLAPRLVRAIVNAESMTAGASRLLVRIALDYSARQMMASAAALMARHGSARAAGRADIDATDIDMGAFSEALEQVCHSVPGVPPVDLLIRTSGEQRLSDFLLWESAYAELVFTPTFWPDFGAADLQGALAELGRRERRFGCLPPAVSVGAHTDS